MEHVSGRVALVTGASRGIGRQTAVTLARAGWDVAFTARTGVEGSGTVPPRTGYGEVTVEGVPPGIEVVTAPRRAVGGPESG